VSYGGKLLCMFAALHTSLASLTAQLLHHAARLG
jgi:hypothetical protein